MNIRKVIPDINTKLMKESMKFYTDFLGFQVALDMNGVITVISPSNITAQINLLQNLSATPSQQSLAISIEVEDVNALHTRAVELGVQIIYPLTEEPWGVLRVHLLDQNGVVINILMYNKT